MRDCTLSWMRLNLPPKQRTLKRYCQINWMGSMSVSQVLNEPELCCEVPRELLRDFLKRGNAVGVPATTLAWISELVESEDE